MDRFGRLQLEFFILVRLRQAIPRLCGLPVWARFADADNLNYTKPFESRLVAQTRRHFRGPAYASTSQPVSETI
jgi:hypothetical protein